MVSITYYAISEAHQAPFGLRDRQQDDGSSSRQWSFSCVHAQCRSVWHGNEQVVAAGPPSEQQLRAPYVGMLHLAMSASRFFERR